MSVPEEKVKKRIQLLRDEINRHNYLYYVKNKPEIPDGEFDALLRELRELESRHPRLITPDSPTQKVGGEPVGGFQTVEHPTPMFSIDNTYNETELREFDERVNKRLDAEKAGKPSYVLEPKIDGLAINLIYRGGVLEQAVTRGNGRSGDDVTHNARTITNLPLMLDAKAASAPDDLKGTFLEVRGEVYIPLNSFSNLNARREKNGNEPFANPRNAAAGTLKLLDPSVAAKRKLHIFTYEVGLHEGFRLPDSHIETLSLLSRLGYPVSPDILRCENIDEVLQQCVSRENAGIGLNYAVDGLVIKVDSRTQRRVLGHTTKVPRYMIAYKFGAERALSTVKDIRIQVGKSGRQTPVVDVEPVSLSGTVVCRASLHNFDELRRKDVRIGDSVYVEKAGEIIPQVVKVRKDLRCGGEKVVQAPVNCASCGKKVDREPGGVYLRCINPSCPAQMQERIEHFGSRGAMDIEGLGPAIVKQLVDNELIRDCADLYSLEEENIATLERMEKKSARNLVQAIEESKDRGLSRLLYGFGIPHTGAHLAEVLAENFHSIGDLMEASESQLEDINEIGAVVAKSIKEFFSKETARTMIGKLQRAGVKTSIDEASGARNAPLSGKRFVITGTLENYGRNEITKIIKSLGGRVTSSVSGNTDYLIAGSDPGGKLHKAQEKGVEIINEESFEKMLDGA